MSRGRPETMKMPLLKSGEQVLCTLLKHFTALSKSKIEKALEEKPVSLQEYSLAKSLKLSDDIAFEQVLCAFYVTAEFALPSLMHTLIQWYQSQHSSGTQYAAAHRRRAKVTNNDHNKADDLMSASCHIGYSDKEANLTAMTRSEKMTKSTCDVGVTLQSSDVLTERRDLPYHPGHNELIEQLLDQSFRRFKHREDVQAENAKDVNLVADLYAEIVGLLSQTRFVMVRSRFMRHLNGLRAKEQSANVRPCIVSLIMGMKFFRVKMHPIEDFVNCFTFLQELGQYFLDVKELEIKHVLSDLFVEILLPVAAVARQEVNIPALKQFVENLYPTSIELANKKKHIPALFPLVTCLLCVGTKSFFLNNWHNFLSICLSQLKNRNPNVALVSLQSLSCLLWVYIVRIRGEKHPDTLSKLHAIVNSVFPKNQKLIVPKDAPVNILVRIIQFIAHEKLEFAVKEIIIDRLGVNGLQKNLYMPERMNIGLCAFLLVAHGLQQKEGAPPMPQQSIGGVSGLRQTVIKRSFNGKNLNDDLGHDLGIQNYLVPIRRAFEVLLSQLDAQVCRPMMMAKQDLSQKELEDLMTAERKPKMDLLKTCVACIPRLLPHEMPKPELIELLAKVCLHVDEDVRKMAQQAMANLIVELPTFRVQTIQAFVQFVQKNVADTSPHQLDMCLKNLFHLLNNWKLAIEKEDATQLSLADKVALYETEGFALVMLCHCRATTRRLVLHILRKCRVLINLINASVADAAAGPKRPRQQPPSQQPPPQQPIQPQQQELCCIDFLDRSVPSIVERILPLVPPNERGLFTNVANLDFSVLLERASPTWLGGPVPLFPCPPLVLSTHVVHPGSSSLEAHSGLTASQGVTSVAETVATSKDAISTESCATNRLSGDPSSHVTTKTSQTPSSNPSVARKSELPTGVGQQADPRTSPMRSQQAYWVQPIQQRGLLIGDLWGTCLAVAFSPYNLLAAHCPQAVQSAWSMLFQRLSVLFPLVDPNAQIAENRASSLLRSSSKKPTTEREQLIPLWHNYAVLACSIAPNTTGCRVSRPRSNRYVTTTEVPKSGGPTAKRALTPLHIKTGVGCASEPGDSRVTSQTSPAVNSPTTLGPDTSGRPPIGISVTTETKCTPSPILRDSARDLVKLLVPLLRCEQSDIRDSAVGALGRINPAAFRDVLEELHPLLKESVDRKQENVRRRKRRDGLRAALIRVLALMSQSGLFIYPESNAFTNQGCLIPQLTDYLDGMRIYLESVADQASNPTTITPITCSATATSAGTSAAVAAMATNNAVVMTPSAWTGPGTPSSTGSCSSLMTPTSTHTMPPPVASFPATSSATAPGLATASYLSAASTENYVLLEIRLHLCVFVLDLIRQLPKEKRTMLLPSSVRQQLFLLISRWSGYYNHVMGTHCELDSGNYAGVLPRVPLPSMVPGFPSGATLDASGPSGISSSMESNQTTAGDSANSTAVPNQSQTGLTGLVETGLRSHNSASHTSTASPALIANGNVPASSELLGGNSFTSPDNWEARLWNDLSWTANQAMGVLACCGPIYDTAVLFADRVVDLPTTSHVTASEHATYPMSGYMLRWVSGLLVARDPRLECSPWLWHCPNVDAACGTQWLTSAVLGGLPIRGGERRMDSLLRQLGEEILVLMLDMNQHSIALVNWAVDQCFTATNRSLAAACFLAICRCVSSSPEFACDFVSLLILAFAFLDHPQKSLSDHAFHLLRLLYHRFIIQPGCALHERLHAQEAMGTDSPSGDSASPRIPITTTTTTAAIVCGELKTNVQFLCTLTRLSPAQVVRQFAAQHPDLTLTVFSEVTRRMDSARECMRPTLLRLLIPWIINIELVDLIGESGGGTTTATTAIRKADAKFFLDPDRCTNEGDLDFGYNGIVSPTTAVVCPTMRHFTTETSDSSSSIDDTVETGSDELADDFDVLNQRRSVTTAATTTTSARRCTDPRVGNQRRTRGRSGGDPGAYTCRDLPRSDVDDGDDDDVRLRAIAAAKLKRRSLISPPTYRTRPRKSDTQLPFTSGLRSSGRSTRKRRVSEASRKSGVPSVGQCDEFWNTVPPTLRSSGWGSKQVTVMSSDQRILLHWQRNKCKMPTQATELVLNNLFYLTVRFSERSETTDCVRQLWIWLVRHRASNLRVILRYLILITSVAPAALLSHAKRLVTYLATEQSESVMEELMLEMQTIDGIGLTVERITSAPYFRTACNLSTTVTSVAKVPGSEDNHPPASSPSGCLTQTGVGSRKPELRAAVNPSVLHSVNWESIRQIDPELVAIGLDSCVTRDRLQRIRAKRQMNRYSAVSLVQNKRHTVPEENLEEYKKKPSDRRPNSASSQPFNQSSGQFHPSFNLPTQICATQHQKRSTTAPQISNSASNRLSPEDKYATLRAKDIPSVLPVTDERESEDFSEQESPALQRSAIQVRTGTLPMNAISRERYLLDQDSFSPVEFPPGTTSFAQPTRQHTHLRHSKRVKVKARSQPRTIEPLTGSFGVKVPPHTVSLPPNFAGLQPLPLPLLSGVPSLPLLLLSTGSTTIAKATGSNRSSPATLQSQVRQPELSQSASSTEHSSSQPQPLAMPTTGTYYAPLGSWLWEPLIIGGSTVFSGCWPVAGARSPLVLLLSGGLVQSTNTSIDWTPYMPLMLLCALLGMDHCRALVQEECKQLIISLLSLTCPEQDAFRLLRLELDAGLFACAYPSAVHGPRAPQCWLTPDGGPYLEKFDIPPLTDTVTNMLRCHGTPPKPEEEEEEEEEKSQVITTPAPPPPRKPERRDLAKRHSASPPIEITSTLVDVTFTTEETTEALAQANIQTALESPGIPLVTTANRPRWTGSANSLVSTDTLIPGIDEVMQPMLGRLTSNITAHRRTTHSTVDAPVGTARFPASSMVPDKLGSGVAQRTRATAGTLLTPQQPLKPNRGPVARSPEVPADMWWNNLTDKEPLQAAVQTLRELLMTSAGQAVWTWDEESIQRGHSIDPTSIDQCATSVTDPINPQSSTLQQLVSLVARILALVSSDVSEAEHCLQCHHGPPHEHRLKNRTDACSMHVGQPVGNFCLVARLSQTALNMGLTSPNRHYASRSLQIFRILGAHLDRRSLSHLLSRLGETVADGNEEIKGYVSELFQTLEASIWHLQSKSNSLMTPLLKRTNSAPGQTRTAPASPRAGPTRGWSNIDVGPVVAVAVSDRRRQQRHSTSAYLLAAEESGASCCRPPVVPRSPGSSDSRPMSSKSARSSTLPKPSVPVGAAAATQMSINCRLSLEEQSDLVCGVFWAATCLLESDFEEEYLAGLRLLIKLVPSVCADEASVANNTNINSVISSAGCTGLLASESNSQRPNLPRRAKQLLSQLHAGAPFKGLLNLAVKGCSSANLLDPACQLLVCLIPCLNSPLVVANTSKAFGSQLSYPIALLTLMPMLLTAWDEDPTTVNLLKDAAGASASTANVTTVGTSELQGGFLGRGVCATNLTAGPRALGSWASTAGAGSRWTNAAPNGCLTRTDSIGAVSLPGLPLAGSGAFGASMFNYGVPPGVNVTAASAASSKWGPRTPLTPKNPVCIRAANALAQAALQIDSTRLASLASVLRMYANGTFSKDIDQWAKCIVCYLLEGYTKQASQLLQYLTTLLTAGPVCIQWPLLRVACLFLQQVELTSPELNQTVSCFINTLSAQFLGTAFWPEITRIYQAIVSRSAVLSAVPPPSVYTLSGLDPSGSGRVLDMAAAAAAIAVPLPESEPPRLELAGPVLEFRFDLAEEAPLLAPHVAPLPTTGPAATAVDMEDEDRGALLTMKHQSQPVVKSELHVADDWLLSELFHTAASSWTRPGNCQARLRDRIYRLAGCFGLAADCRFGNPRSPSVIFSHSTETLDPQLSVHSSSETTSMVDVSNSDDIHREETSSIEQAAVFRDLDTYLDAQLMNINFLGVPDGRLASASEDEPRRPWGVRGQSITCHQDFNDDTLEPVTTSNHPIATVREQLPSSPRRASPNMNSNWSTTTQLRTRREDAPPMVASAAIPLNEDIIVWEEDEELDGLDDDPEEGVTNLTESNEVDATVMNRTDSWSHELNSNDSSHHLTHRPEPSGELSSLQCSLLNGSSYISASPSPQQRPLHVTTATSTPCVPSSHHHPRNRLSQTSLVTTGRTMSPIESSSSSVMSGLVPSSSDLLLGSRKNGKSHDGGIGVKAVSSISLPPMSLSDHYLVVESAVVAVCESTVSRSAAVSPDAPQTPIFLHSDSSPPPLMATRVSPKSVLVQPAQQTTPPPRSFSTSSLSLPLPIAESNSPTPRIIATRPKVTARSPVKRTTPSTGVLGRLSSPFVKFHRSIMHKRHSSSAEDLPQSTRSKVTFVVPAEIGDHGPEGTTAIRTSCSPPPTTTSKGSCWSLNSPTEGVISRVDARHQPSEGLSSDTRLSPRAAAAGDGPIGTTGSGEMTRVIRIPRSPPPHVWLDWTTHEREWIALVARNSCQSIQMAFVHNLSDAFAILASRCLSALTTVANMSGCSWDDTSELRHLKTVAEMFVYRLRPPLVITQSDKTISLSEDTLSTVTLLSDRHEAVYSLLSQIGSLLSARNPTSARQLLTGLLNRLADWFQLSCAVNEQVYAECRRTTNFTVITSVANQLVQFVQRVFPELPGSVTTVPHGSTTTSTFESAEMIARFTQLLDAKTNSEEVSQLVALATDWRLSAEEKSKSVSLNYSPILDTMKDVLEAYVQANWNTSTDGVPLIYIDLPALGTGRAELAMDYCSQLRQWLK